MTLMAGPSSAVVSWLTRWVAGLRFPWLLAITAAVFLVDLFVPDFVPLADEVLLGLLTMIFASLKRRSVGAAAGSDVRSED
jgi:hypothetical protein